MTYKFELHKDGLFAVPDDTSNGLLIPGVTEKDIQKWIYKEWEPTYDAYGIESIESSVRLEPWEIEVGDAELRGYFIGHQKEAKQCNELGEPI